MRRFSLHFCPQFDTLETRRRLVPKCVPNRLFPICLKPLFQSEVKCEAIDMKMIFDYNANKTHLHNKGFSLSLVLKVRFFGNRKWLIASGIVTGNASVSYWPNLVPRSPTCKTEWDLGTRLPLDKFFPVLSNSPRSYCHKKKKNKSKKQQQQQQQKHSSHSSELRQGSSAIFP